MRCGRDQPHRVAADAKRVAERTLREREEQKGDRRRRSPSRGRSRDRQQRGRSKGRSPSRTRSAGEGGAWRNGKGKPKKSYAEAAKKTEDDLRRQLAAEKKAREDLARQLASASSNPATTKETTTGGGGGGGNADAGGDEAGDDEAESDAAKELRQQQLTAAIDALEPLVDATDEKLQSLRRERDALAKARREGRPLKAQLLAIDRRLEKRKGALRKVEEKLSDAWARAEKARKEAEALDVEQSEVQKEIDDLENEKREILRRELEGEPGVTTKEKEMDHWEGTLAAIRARLELPGIDNVLATAIGTTLEQLRLQCAQLPAELPSRPTPPKQPSEAATTNTTTGPTTPSAGTPTERAARFEHKEDKSGKGGKNSEGSANDSGKSKGGLTAGPPVVLGPNGQGSSPSVEQRAGTTTSNDKPPTALLGPEIKDPASEGTNSGQGHAGGEEEGEEELCEDKGDQMAVDEVINLLPSRHRTRVREAIRNGEASDLENDRARRDRERSPRPTKVGEDKAH